MKEGDLVAMSDREDIDNSGEVGIVLKVINNVEVPPLIQVMWDGGYIFTTHQDELRVVSKRSE